MTTTSLAPADPLAALTAHNWTQQPEAAKLVQRILNDFLQRCPFASSLAQRMLTDTGTRFVDWIDHIGLANDDNIVRDLANVGYRQTDSSHGEAVWIHQEGLFPRIRILREKTLQIAIKVEVVADFLFAHQLSKDLIQGEPFSPLRKACVAKDHEVEFWVVERHGTLEFEPPAFSLEMLGDLQDFR